MSLDCGDGRGAQGAHACTGVGETCRLYMADGFKHRTLTSVLGLELN